MSSSICIPNMTLLACKIVEKFLTKKSYGITEGRTDGMTDRCKPVYPPLFQSGGIIILYQNNFAVAIYLKQNYTNKNSEREFSDYDYVGKSVCKQ